MKDAVRLPVAHRSQHHRIGLHESTHPASVRSPAAAPPLAILYEVMSNTRSPITVYTTEPCSFCARVKGILASHGLEFSEVNLSKDPAGRIELVHRTGMMTFPQVLVGDELLGGYSETLKASENGRLDELLAA